MIKSVNPANGEVIGEVAASTPDEIHHKVQAARQAQPLWQAVPLATRVEKLRALPTLFAKFKNELSELTSREMGRPIVSSGQLTDYAITQFIWNLDHAEACLANEISYEDAQIVHEVIREPFGVVACIMAWNFPIGNFVFSVSQAMIAGNAVIVKYSEEIPLFAALLEKICAQAGLPDGVLSFVQGDGTIGACLADEEIDLISFTGSSQTGRTLHAKAAQKGIPAILEMGGSSPGIVFADADIDTLLPALFALRYDNSGQFCDNLKRLIVHQSLYQRCLDGLAALATKHRLGDPLDPTTQMGPLVAERQVVRLEEQIRDAVAKGADVVCGGMRPAALKGAWYEPTILSRITPDMRVWTEEVFGPALPVVAFETHDEAIALANDTCYGLTGYVFTSDPALGVKTARALKAGCVSVNGADYFHPATPFGGYKASGLGRENGKWGFHDVTQVKVIAHPKGHS